MKCPKCNKEDKIFKTKIISDNLVGVFYCDNCGNIFNGCPRCESIDQLSKATFVDFEYVKECRECGTTFSVGFFRNNRFYE